MRTGSDYKIDLSQIKGGVFTQSYRLGQPFFDLFPEQEIISDGDVAVELVIKKQAGEFLVQISIEGVVTIPCDRCLAAMQQEIEIADDFVVRLGLELMIGDEIITTSDDDPNYDYTLPPGSDLFDLSWPLYELMILALPMQHIHQEGDCDLDMEHLLEEHLAVLPGGNTEDSSDEGFEDEEEEIDPRWKQLKKILNNN